MDYLYQSNYTNNINTDHYYNYNYLSNIIYTHYKSETQSETRSKSRIRKLKQENLRLKKINEVTRLYLAGVTRLAQLPREIITMIINQIE